MPVYPNAAASAATEPYEEPPRTPLDWMDECRHREACERVYLRHIDARELVGWEDEMAHLLRCDDCEAFS